MVDLAQKLLEYIDIEYAQRIRRSVLVCFLEQIIKLAPYMCTLCILSNHTYSGIDAYHTASILE